MKLCVCLFVLSCIFYATVQSASLPKGFTACKKDDENFKECLGKAMVESVRSLKNGNPALKVPIIDPYYLSAANIGKGNGAVDVAQNYTDINIRGMADIKEVKVLKINTDKFELEFEAYSPKIVWDAKYKAAGKILSLPISGEGSAVISLSNTKSLHKISGDYFKKKDGNTYIKCTNYDLQLDPDNVNFMFGSFVKENKLISDTLIQVMNENWKELYRDVGRGYELIIAAVCQNICNNIFGRIPSKDLFL